ncbi:putative Polyamine transporter 1 [Seiridium cardinale]
MGAVDAMVTAVTLAEAEKVTYQGNIVDWDDPDDPQNPQNWPKNRKWTTIVFVSLITFNQAMSSTIFAPGVPQAMRDFHSDSEANETLLISIYVIGLAVGPLFLSPLSEIYGRMPIMHGTNLLFLVATTLCATSVNIPMLMVFRFALGLSTVSLGGGYVADLMEPELRHRAMNVWTVGPVLAPVIGPIAGGFISLKTTWRWTFGMLSITGALAMIGSLVFLCETYPPRLLELKARRLRTETHNPLLRSKYDVGHNTTQLLRVSIIRPVEILFRSPILGLVSLFLAIAYSYMYLMFTTLSSVFSAAYNFNDGEVGLCYLGLGVGSLIGQYALDLFNKGYAKKQLARNGEARPEDQLPPLIIAGLLLSAGLFWYGWSIEYKLHWIVPILGTGLCGVAITFFFIAVQTFIVEVYSVHAASALAASTAIRCVFGVTIPLAGPFLYRSLGLGWGNSLLGFLALTIVPASLWLLRSSAQMRKNSKYVLTI